MAKFVFPHLYKYSEVCEVGEYVARNLLPIFDVIGTIPDGILGMSVVIDTRPTRKRDVCRFAHDA